MIWPRNGIGFADDTRLGDGRMLHQGIEAATAN